MCSRVSSRTCCGELLAKLWMPHAHALSQSPRMPMRRFNETLMRENELFESYLQRSMPSFVADDADMAGKGRKSMPSKKAQHLLLTTEQKYDISTQEMEEVRDEIDATKTNSEKLLDSLRASMEECDVRIAEIKKDAYEFKRDIVTGAENFRTGKTIAEKAVRCVRASPLCGMRDHGLRFARLFPHQARAPGPAAWPRPVARLLGSAPGGCAATATATARPRPWPWLWPWTSGPSDTRMAAAAGTWRRSCERRRRWQRSSG